MIAVMLCTLEHSTGYGKPCYRATVLLCLLLTCIPASAAADLIDPYHQLLIATCYTCHSSANDAPEAIPGLHGQSATDIRDKLLAYKNDREQGTMMNRVSKALTDAEIDRISAILGRQQP